MRHDLSRILCLVLALPLVFSACNPSGTNSGNSSAAPSAKSEPAPRPVLAPAKAVPSVPKPASAPPVKATPETPKPVPAPPKAEPVKEPEHIPNGSFEIANNKGGAAVWWSDDPKAARDKKAHSGEFAMKLHPSTKKNEIRHLSVAIRNGKTLLGKHVTVKAFTAVKLRPKAGSKAPAPFAMHLQYAVDGKEQEFYHLYGGGPDWGEATVSGSIPANADPDSLRLVIAVRSSAADPVLLDDVTLSLD